MTTTTTLPTADSPRWKPLRAGLVDIFYYDVEEFHFHDGRLLLRGNNGTGKSKVLALTLPFLLDGELSPHRVEPDGDRQKRMEWNLLLGGRHPHPERVGYTWMEFGRVQADGTPEYRTIGCGLKAVKDRGIARHWYVVTSQRVGDDLSLLGQGGVPLTRERLRDAVDGHGMVYNHAYEYRRAVDEAMFGLGKHRYEALVNLLIQLRQPQLSKKPDEKRLSLALTEALPPVSPDLIQTVAESFRGLDAERHAIDGLREAEGAATEFLGHYRRYAEVAAKRVARGPRETQSRYEALGRDLSEAERKYTEADGALQAATDRLTELGETKGLLDAQYRALEQSPQMRDAERVEHLRAEADRLGEYADQRASDQERLGQELGRHRAATDRLETRRLETTGAFETTSAAAAAGARRAGCEDEHREVADAWETDLPAARRETEDLAKRRTTAVRELEGLLEEQLAARGRVDAAQREVDRLTAELQADADRIIEVEQTIGDQADDLARRYRAYLSAVTTLRVPDPDTALSLLETWTDNVDGPNPAAEAVEAAVRHISTELGHRERGLQDERTERSIAAAELTEEIERLQTGGHDTPPVPYTRNERGRFTRPGAPLWKVIDFAEGVSDDHRAMV